jgi:hypothetical protein
MDASVIPAIAALAGAAIGSFTSVVASWLTQHTQARMQRRTQNQNRREDLCKEFIGDASRLYIDALQNNKPDVSALMGLYAELSRMRILSSAEVVNCADQIVKKIVDSYLEPNKTFPELREMANSGMIDPLGSFSEACRAEFQFLRSPFDR